MQKAEFRKALGQIAAELRRTIETTCERFDSQPSKVARRRRLAEKDFGVFCQLYFPHYLRYTPPSCLHTYLFDRLKAIVEAPTSQAEAIAAPRGEAKSTIVSLLFVIWCDLTKRKHYTVLIMDAYEQALVQLEAIKAEYEVNPRLAIDFPDATGPGRVWQTGVIVTKNGNKIEAFGTGRRIRGRRHGPYRPDLVICDDLENDENVRSPVQRDKVESWLTKSVMQLGGAGEKLDVIVIGTILHYDSVLARLLANPLWQGRRFRAILKWPHRMDLWDRWEEILRNDGTDAARAFYEQHAQDMQDGAEVSWPAARSLYDLMLIRARDGHAAFDSEFQNEPIDQERALFQHITFWVEPEPDWVFFGACDPSLGKYGAQRDPSAILVGGYSRRTGILDVVEARIRRRLPDQIIAEIIGLQQQYHCLVWAIESVQFQEFLRTELVKRSAAAGCPVPARPVIPHADKTLRIESLQPHIANGLIRLHPSQTTLIEQLRHWPAADHDDGPDALHMLWALATSSGSGLSGRPLGLPRWAAQAMQLTQRGWGTIRRRGD